MVADDAANGRHRRARCLCVFSRILGWSVFGRFVDRALAENLGSSACDYVNYDQEAFRIEIPWHFNISAGTRTHYRITKHIDNLGVVTRNYDSFIVQGHQLAMPLRRLAFGKLMIIADTTPAITVRREAGRLGVRSLAKRVWCSLQNAYAFRPLFRRVTAFLVLSDFVKRSLVEDYDVDEGRVFTIGPPIFDRIVALGKQPKPLRPVLLFVGNDFERKGGPFLVDLYKRHFADRSDLWIVSNGVKGPLGPGIRLFSNIPHESVLELLLQSHIFVFPSYHDELGLVLAEAACAGLPIVARESGGQSEYVHDGINGFLLEPKASPAAWVDAIGALLSDEALRTRMSRESSSLAQRLCSQARFDSVFREFLSVGLDTPMPDDSSAELGSGSRRS